MPRKFSCDSKFRWTLIKAVLRCSLAVMSVMTVVDLLSYDVLTNQQLLSRSQLFPAVTVCNVASYVQKRFSDIPQLEDADTALNLLVDFFIGTNDYGLMLNKKERKRSTEIQLLSNSNGKSKLLIAHQSDSCTKTCHNKGLLCRNNYFHDIPPANLLDALFDKPNRTKLQFRDSSNLKHCSPVIHQSGLVFCLSEDQANNSCSQTVTANESRVCSCEEGRTEFTMTEHNSVEYCSTACERIGKKCRFGNIFAMTSNAIEMIIRNQTGAPEDIRIHENTDINSSMPICPFYIKNTAIFCTQRGSYNPSCDATNMHGFTRGDSSLLCECSNDLGNYIGNRCNCLNDGYCLETEQERICYCKPGYYGERCEHARDACINHLCAYGSTCIDHHSTYSCLCPKETIGQFCNSVPCETNTCASAKRCLNLKDSYVCVSPDEEETFHRIFLKMFNTSSNILELILGGSGNSGTILEKILHYFDRRIAKNFVQLITPYVKNEDGEAVIQVLGVHVNKYIYSCKFNQGPCMAWTKNYHSQYGLCYSFNNNKTTQLRLSERVGPEFGLNVMFDFNSDQDAAAMNGLVYKVVFHEPGGSVDPDNEGQAILPGYSTDFHLNRISQKSLPEPYGSCIQSKYQIYPYYYSQDYTVDNCVKSYAQMVTMLNCSCISPRFHYPSDSNMESCAVTLNSICSNVIEQVITEVEHCKEACKNSYVQVGLVLKQKLRKCKSAQTGMCKHIKRVAKVSAHFSMLQSNSFQEYPKLTIPMALSGFGGYSGLFLGYSFITLIEFVCYLVRLTKRCMKWVHENNSN